MATDEVIFGQMETQSQRSENAELNIAIYLYETQQSIDARKSYVENDMTQKNSRHASLHPGNVPSGSQMLGKTG